MAELNSRIESFIETLLKVSGKARPQDLQGVALADAAEILRQFAAAHPELGVQFDGQSLSRSGQAAPAPTPVPAAAATPAAGVPPHEAAWMQAPAPVPSTFGEPQPAGLPDAGGYGAGMQAPAPGFAEPAPAPQFAPVPDSTAYAAADGSFAPPQDFGAPMPAVDAQPQSFEPAPMTDFEPVTDFGAPLFNEPMLMEQPKVAWYWWLIAVLFGWLGGLVGFLVVRSSNQRGARNVLLTGILVSVLSAVLAVAGFALLGGAAFLAR